MIGCCKSCGNKAVENRDLMLCSSCNRQRRKPPVKPKKRTPIRAVSAKKASALTKLAKTKVKMRESEIRYCTGCGCSDKPLSHSHTLPVGQYPDLESDLENLNYECYGYNGSCHEITETGDLEMQESLSNWPKKLAYILRVKPEYLEKIKLRNLKRERL